MFKCFKKYGGFEFYAERRLLFEKPKEQPPTDAELLASTGGLLRKLQTEVGSPSSRPTAYHTERRDTRKPTKVPPHYPGSVEQVTEALTLGSYMSKKEVERMQVTHENLYEQYMNPAFMLYLKQRGFYDEVYGNLELILQHPYDFEYIPKPNQRLEIVKRRPYKKYNSGIPDDFLVVMETTEGYITEVNGTNLKMAGDIPWMSGSEYNTKARDYYEQWTNEWTRNLYGERYQKWVANGQQPPNEWEKIYRDSFAAMPEGMRAIHMLNNVEFPKRFIALVQSRHLGWEEQDPLYQDVVAHQKKQGSTYEEITRDGKIYVMVAADLEIPGAYRIVTSERYEKGLPPLRVSAEGFMLVDRGEGQTPRWVADPRYDHVLFNRYYADNPDAKGKLSADERKEQEEREKQEKDRREAEKKKADEDKIKLDEAKKRRTEVDTALASATLPKLKEAAKAIPISENGNAERRAKIEAEKDAKTLRAMITKALEEDSDGSSHKKAAEILVDNPAKLLEEQKKRKGIDAALKKADLPTLETVIRAITPADYQATIDTWVKDKDKKMILKGIKYQLDHDPDGSSHKKAADILGVASPA